MILPTQYAPGAPIYLRQSTNRTGTLLLAAAMGTLLMSSLSAVAGPEDDIVFTQGPRNGQVVPRDLATQQGIVRFSGRVTNSRYREIRLRAFRQNTRWGDEISKPLQFEGGPAGFDFEIAIPAELANYRFEVFLARRKRAVAAARFDQITCGDIYLVNGGSNALAGRRAGEANQFQHTFLRSFGTRDARIRTMKSDPEWHVAEGDQWEGPGAVGQWALRLGAELVKTHGIPIGILNGADREKSIGFFRRSANDPTALHTNYGRLLHRAELAGAKESARAIFWYQGESDEGDAAAHQAGFDAIHAAWREDYPALERIYVIQVREGCGVEAWDLGLREVQRRFGERYNDVTLVSTSGINQHDGCHYAFPDGYERLGEMMAWMVSSDLYRTSPAANPVRPPRPFSARLAPGYPSRVIVETVSTNDVLTWDAGAHADFRIDGADILVTNGIAQGNQVILELDEVAHGAQGVSYRGHAFSGPWITNSAGFGLLSFSSLPILHEPPGTPQQLRAHGQSCEQVDLTWAADVEAVSFLIQRDGIVVGITEQNEFHDTVPNADTGYLYQLAAENSGGISTWSASVHVETPPVPPPPALPTGLTVQVRSGTRVELRWVAATNATSYLVRRDDEAPDLVHDTFYVDMDTDPGGAYEYAVAARNPGATSEWSSSVALTTVVDNVFALVPEAQEYELIYSLELEEDFAFGQTNRVPYERNLSGRFSGPFDRVAYYLELQTSVNGPFTWVYVSMDSFTDHIGKVGVPARSTGVIFQQPVSNLNIYASADVYIPTGVGLSEGSIEFWGYNYSPNNVRKLPNATDSTYDAGDEVSRAGTVGSMQIHRSGDTVFAYNRWGAPGTDDLGIGNAPGIHSDWTFSGSAEDYARRKLVVLVRLDGTGAGP